MPIWIDFMQDALVGSPERTMERPDGLVDRLIDRNTGQFARPGQANTMFELFLAETAPTDSDIRQPEMDCNDEDSICTEMLF